MAAFFVHILLSPVVLLGRGIQTAVANIIGARVHPHLEKLLKEEKKSSVPVVVGAVASTAVVVGANLAYKASMSKNDKWRYENYEIVNSIVDLKRLTPLVGSSSFLEGRCYGLTVNKMSGEVITSLVALNNLGSNGSTWHLARWQNGYTYLFNPTAPLVAPSAAEDESDESETSDE